MLLLDAHLTHNGHAAEARCRVHNARRLHRRKRHRKVCLKARALHRAGITHRAAWNIHGNVKRFFIFRCTRKQRLHHARQTAVKAEAEHRIDDDVRRVYRAACRAVHDDLNAAAHFVIRLLCKVGGRCALHQNDRHLCALGRQ